MAEINTITPQVSLLQVPTSVKSLVEALIFGAREPLTVRQIQGLYEDQGSAAAEPRKISYEEIGRVVEELNAEYTASDRPYRIIQIAGGYQFATQPAYAEWLGKLYKEQTRRKLSQSSVETLAIIAYKQPITKPELEAIRGVNCDYVLSTLLEKDLATIVGRAPTVGRPLLYGTSKEFLKHFGLNDLNDLPRPREIQEILGESQFETERRMLEAQQGLDEPKKEEDFKSRLPHIPKRKAGLDDDVKILPKKRTREIKVRPAEESTSGTPEAVKEERVVSDSLETTSATIAQDQDVQVPELAAPEAAEVRMQENAQDQAAQLDSGELEATDREISSEQSRYIGLLQSDATDADETLPGETDTLPVENGQDDELVASRSSIAEDAAAPAEFQEAPVEQAPVPIEERLIEPEMAAEAADVEAPVVESEVAVVADAAEEISVSIPQAVPPTVEESAEVVGHAEPEMAHADEPDTNSGSQSKPRWKTWKEKIQGFIKKLFG
jgi:segregation and condensation protein B